MACCGAPGKPKPASKFWSSRIGHDSRFASMSACCGGGCCQSRCLSGAGRRRPAPGDRSKE
jgi:hypothetical protein